MFFRTDQTQPIDLEALEALLAMATPGKWDVAEPWAGYAGINAEDKPIFYTASHNCPNAGSDHVAIAALHNAAPALIAELRALRAEIAHVIERFGDSEEEQTLMQVVESVFLNGEQGWKMAGDLQEANRWRPIAEAPRDGRDIEIWVPSEGKTYIGRFAVSGKYRYWWFREVGRIGSQPSHFRPLPEPPEGA